ncbi:hypothetical protein J2T20_002575 [Paenibacillus wynnii]|nr:hypothetical protein [Paenibacillus wynnii]
MTAIRQGGRQVRLTWRDNAWNETGFVIERSINGGAYFALVTIGPRFLTGNVNFTDRTVIRENRYTYRVAAINATGMSAYSNTATVNL